MRIPSRIASTLVLAALLAPSLVFAQAPQNIDDLYSLIIQLVNGLIPVLVGAALVIFLYGLVKYVTAGDADRDGAVAYIVWGIVGLFVMVSVWGLVAILNGTFGGVGASLPVLGGGGGGGAPIGGGGGIGGGGTTGGGGGTTGGGATGGGCAQNGNCGLPGGSLPPPPPPVPAAG